MSLTQLGQQPGTVESLIVEADYVADPLALYQSLCANKDDNLLLESAEIDSKDNLSSLLLVDAAVKIICQAKSVKVEALSSNGEAIIAFLHTQLDSELISAHSKTQLTLCFPEIANDLDEDSRLRAVSPFETLRVLVNQLETIRDHHFAVFLGGVFAYDYLANFETLPTVEASENSCPDYQFYLAETLVVIDHQQQKSEIIGSVFSGETVGDNFFKISQRIENIKQLITNLAGTSVPISKPLNGGDGGDSGQSVSVDISDEEFKHHVLRLKKHIVDGDIFQVVPSRSFSIPCDDSLTAYQILKTQNPSPYMFYMKDKQFCLFGASPESALKFSAETRDVEIYPIAGTRIRGFNPDGSINADLDSRIELNLRDDEKEKAEHMMLVDLARNDIARVSQPGSRYVTDLLKVDRYSHVMHLVSRVVGKLRTDLDALHAYQACMNMGTLVGAPKVKAAELIRKTEKKRRGSYGGAVGYLTGDGDMDTCIVIRSAFVKDEVAYVQAGAGVVFDSDPQAEADETRNKAQAVISAIQASHRVSNNSGAS